jgi:hypothetical protein
MKTHETSNTKHVDIFLRFPMNIARLASLNRALAMAIGRQHGANFFMEIWKQIELSKTYEDLV